MPDGSSSPRKLIKWPVVHKMIGKSRTQVWRDIRAGRFPQPVELGPNSIGWYEDEIAGYQQSRPRRTYGTDLAPQPVEAA